MRTLVAIGMVVALTGGSVAAERLRQTSITWFQAELSGATDAPDPGDPDGAGDLRLDFASPAAQSLRFDAPTPLRFTLTVSGITLPAAAAHIHRGESGAAGPVVVPFPMAPDADGRATGTITVPADLMTELVNNSAAFYVNVHTTDYPDGAVRGQLRLLAIGGGEETEVPSPTGMPSTGVGDTAPLVLVLMALVIVALGLRIRWCAAHPRVRRGS